MANYLKVSTQELRTASGNFSSCGSEVRNLTSQMLSLISGISGTIWEGDAASTYRSKFAALDQDMQKINTMIQEHVDDLNTMATEFETAEQKAQEEASSLKSGII